MSDYGTFESLGHEGYDKKIAAEKRDEALDRAAARIIEDTGDFFRNAASQDDFNQRWDMGITNVRRAAAKETDTSDDTMNAIRERVAALTIDTKPKPRKRAARRKQAAQWENDGENAVRIEFPPGYWYRVQETFRGDFEVSHNGDDGTPWTFGPYDTLEEAKAEAIDDAKTRGVYREASHRVAMDIDWMEANGEFYGANSRGELCHITPIPGGGYSLMTGTTRGSRSHRTEHATLEEAKAAADLPPSQRAARRKDASVSPEQVTIDGKTGYMYQTDGLYDYLVYPNVDGTYWDLYSKYRTNDHFLWSQAGLSLSEAQQEAEFQVENDKRFTGNPDRDAPKATATTLRTPKGDTVRLASRRKSSALTWEQDGVGAYADKGDNTAYHIFKYPGDEYFSIKYYSDRMNGDGRIIDHASTLDEAKSIAEQEDVSGRTARRKRAFNSYTDWSDFSGGGETGYIVDTSDGGTYYVVTTDGASWSVYFEPLVGDMETVQTDITDPDVAKAWAGHHQFKRLPNAYASRSARRKQAWSLGADGMTYTSDVAQDGFDCPSCGTGNKLGFSRCACGKQWNSYTIEGANGERRMVAREVEARPEAVLANRRRQARRKRAASEWFQRGNSERIELPGGVWCEVSEMSGKPGGPYGFIYGDGESVSGNVYDIGFPTMEQAKAAALDEVGFGGITANRRRQAGRARHSTRRAKRRTASTFTWDQDGHNPNGVSVGVFNDGWSFELEQYDNYMYEYRLYSPDQRGVVGAYGFDTEDAAISEAERQHTFHTTGEDPYNRNGKPSGKALQLLSNRRPMEGRNKSAYQAGRRAAQRKQAGTLQWTQDPQEPKSWSAESGQWAFDIVVGTDLWVFKDYQDGDMPISVKTYPDTDSAKRAAEDIANGNADPDQGVTARRKRTSSESLVWDTTGGVSYADLPGGGGGYFRVQELGGGDADLFLRLYKDSEEEKVGEYGSMADAQAAAQEKYDTPGFLYSARRPRRAGRKSSNSAYDVGYRAARRNAPLNPDAPLAYLTGYRDYLRSAIERG